MASMDFLKILENSRKAFQGECVLSKVTSHFIRNRALLGGSKNFWAAFYSRSFILGLPENSELHGQLAITCLNLTIETLEQGVKYVMASFIFHNLF